MFAGHQYYNDGSSDVLGKDFRPRSRPRFCIFDYENENEDEDDLVAARAALCLLACIRGLRLGLPATSFKIVGLQ